MPRPLAALGLFALAAAGVASGSACSSPSEAVPGAAPLLPAEDAGAGEGEVGLDAAVAAPAPVPGSGGKGGLGCSATVALAGGRTACVVRVGSVELKLVAPSAPSSRPMRLGLYLHGDGAAAHKSGSVLSAMLSWVDSEGGLGVSALAPNGCSWWQTPAHDCAGSAADRDVAAANVAPLVGALEALTRAFDLRTDGLRYYGASGGSIFLTDAWLPLQGAAYPGVFALMCGAATPDRSYAWDTTDAPLRARSPLWFTYGDKDFLVPEVEGAIRALSGLGFAITEKVVPGAGHCTFDAHAEAMRIWTANR